MPNEANVKKIEYRVINIPASDAPTLALNLNEVGKDGWEVIAITPLTGGSQQVTFKKVKD